MTSVQGAVLSLFAPWLFVCPLFCAILPSFFFEAFKWQVKGTTFHTFAYLQLPQSWMFGFWQGLWVTKWKLSSSHMPQPVPWHDAAKNIIIFRIHTLLLLYIYSHALIVCRFFSILMITISRSSFSPSSIQAAHGCDFAVDHFCWMLLLTWWDRGGGGGCWIIHPQVLQP